MFQYRERRRRRRIVNFALYAQLILDLKKRKTWLLFLLLHPCTLWVRAQPYMQLIHSPAQPRRQKIWGGRKGDGTVQVTRLPPIVGAFVSLLMASVCEFTPSERGEVSRELLKIVDDKRIIIKIAKELIGDCWTAYMEKTRQHYKTEEDLPLFAVRKKIFSCFAPKVTDELCWSSLQSGSSSAPIAGGFLPTGLRGVAERWRWLCSPIRQSTWSWFLLDFISSLRMGLGSTLSSEVQFLVLL